MTAPPAGSGTIETPSPASTIRTMSSVFVVSISTRGATPDRKSASATCCQPAEPRSSRIIGSSARSASVSTPATKQPMPWRRDETPVQRKQVQIIELPGRLVGSGHAQGDFWVAERRILDELYSVSVVKRMRIWGNALWKRRTASISTYRIRYWLATTCTSVASAGSSKISQSCCARRSRSTAWGKKRRPCSVRGGVRRRARLLRYNCTPNRCSNASSRCADLVRKLPVALPLPAGCPVEPARRTPTIDRSKAMEFLPTWQTARKNPAAPLRIG